MLRVRCLYGVCAVFVRYLCGVCAVFVRRLFGVSVVFVLCLCRVRAVSVPLCAVLRWVFPKSLYHPRVVLYVFALRLYILL